MKPKQFSLGSINLNLSWWRRWKNYFILAVLSALLLTIPVKAAEKLYLTYGPLNWSLDVSSLETFAKEGTINGNLASYLQGTSAEQQAEFRAALTKPVPLNPVMASRFFKTPMGEDILTRVGRLITIQGGSNGKYALRGAIVEAAFAPQGFTLLGFLQKLPTNMQIQGELLLGLGKEIEKAVAATELFIADMRQWTKEEAATETAVNFSTLPDIRQPGKYGVQKETWVLNDTSRNRQFYVLVYKPERWREGKTPVIVFSHGLASRPEDYSDGVAKLASYGYVVAMPQHPGSDYKQAQALLEGYSRVVFDVNEFINRPLDITYVIDELQRRNQTEFAGRLNLESVGVAGHSFGGYTALAVAGARIDFDNLEQDCNRLYGALNVSLLLQCQALKLPRKDYNFRDERVKAVMAFNPVNRSIFGQKGLSQITIPVLLGSGSYDPATPPVFEQVASFTWLKTPDKYLALAEGQAHVDFSKLDVQIKTTIDTVSNLTFPLPSTIHQYVQSLALAFFGVYIEKNEDFRPYLQAAYAEYLSQGQEFPLDFISAASADKLAAEIERFKRKY